MVYDCHRNGPAILPEGLSVETMEAFLKAMSFRFYSVGTLDNWDNQEVFRVGTQTYPSQGHTVDFSKVIEWQEAVNAIGPRIHENGTYRHYKGELCETVFADSSGRQIYKNADGVHSMPIEDFFDVVNDNGKLVAKFSHVGDVKSKVA